MIDESYLENLIKNSPYPEYLEHFLRINRSAKGVEYGSFLGLNEPCSVSLGRYGADKDLPKIFNDYKIPYVIGDNVDDVTKMHITSTGIKLPFQKSEDNLELLDHILAVCKKNGVQFEGFAHPITEQNLILASVEKNYQSDPLREYHRSYINIDYSQSPDLQIKNILERRQTTFDDFVGKQLDEVLNNGLHSDGIEKLGKDKFMQSVWRGGTLGNNPYAVISSAVGKECAYSSSELMVSCGYSDGFEAGYKEINGHKYGFVYEYSIGDNQRFTWDGGIQGGVLGEKLDECTRQNIVAYETPIYPHQNKLKGIYVCVDRGCLLQIADEKGFISKDWEDFINLHPTKILEENASEVVRNNTILAAAKKQKSLAHYTGNSFILDKPLDEFLIENMSPEAVSFTEGKYKLNRPLIIKDIPDGYDLSKLENLTIDEHTLIGKDVKWPDNILIRGKIPAGTDFSSAKNLYIQDIAEFGENCKFPDNVVLRGKIPAGTDFSSAKNLYLNDLVELGEGCKLPKAVLHDTNIVGIKGYVPAGADLSKTGNLFLQDIESIGEGVKLPDNVALTGKIPAGTDLSNVKNLYLNNLVEFGEGCKLPENVIPYTTIVTVKGKIPDNANLSKIGGLTLDNVESIDKGIKLPENVIIKGKVSSGTDLSNVKNLYFNDIVELGEGCKLPENILSTANIACIKGHIPAGTDLSKIQNLILLDIESIGKDLKLPDNVTLSGKILVSTDLSDVKRLCLRDVVEFVEGCKLPDNVDLTGKIPAGTDLSNVKNLHLNNFVDFGEGCKLPADIFPDTFVTIKGHIPAGMDLSNVKNLFLENVESIGEGVKLPEKYTANGNNPALEKLGQTEVKTTKQVGKETAELATDAVVKTTANQVAQSSAKSGITSALKKADDKINTTIDKAVEKGSEKLNNTALGKWYSKVSEKVANSGFGKAVSKVGEKIGKVAGKVGSKIAEGAGKVAKIAEKIPGVKALEKVAGKATGKIAGKAIGKSLLKKIPLISVGAGLVFGAQRAMAGDWKGACGEVASGALGTFPGLGTAASVAIDATMAGRDIYNEKQKTKADASIGKADNAIETTSKQVSASQANNISSTQDTVMQQSYTEQQSVSSQTHDSQNLKGILKNDSANAHTFAQDIVQTMMQYTTPQDSAQHDSSLLQAMKQDAHKAINKYQLQMIKLLDNLNLLNNGNNLVNSGETADLLYQKFGKSSVDLLQTAITQPQQYSSMVGDESLKSPVDAVKHLCNMDEIMRGKIIFSQAKSY